MKTCINQQEHEFDVRADETAIDLIRDRVGLTGTKLVCGAGVCGACTILLDDKPVCSCLLPAGRLANKQVRTVENSGRDNLHPIQKALLVHDGLQCGYCTAGFVNAGIGFYETWRKTEGKRKPSREVIAAAMAGNLCRCGAYQGIYAAIQAACVGTYDELTLDQLTYSRVDGLQKVTGEAKYTTDISFEGMLHAKVKRSIHPHARIKSIDWRAAAAMDGVVAIVDAVVSKDRTVNFVGDAIAAVAAVDTRTAAAALDKIEVEYELLPAMIDPKQSRAATNANANKGLRKTTNSTTGAAAFPGRWQGNTRTNLLPLVDKKGRRALRAINRARGVADNHLQEMSFETGAQAHTPLEPHGMIAQWEGETLILHASTQGPNVWRTELAKRYKMKQEHIQIHSQFVGGAFGSKGEPTPEVDMVVALSKESGKPVKLIFDRQEVISIGGIRGAGSGTVSILTNDAGELEAVNIEAYNYNGFATNNMTALSQARSYDAAKSARFRDHDVSTNTPYPKPFRGPGGINGAFMLEATIDQAARQLGLSPIEVRKKWDLNAQDAALYDYLEEVPAWQARDQVRSDTGRFRRGVGLGVGHWLHFYNITTEVTVSATADGIVARCAAQDVGQGATSVMAHAVADLFGLKARDPFLTTATNHSTGKGYTKAGGSQTTTSIFAPAQEAALAVQAQIVSTVTAKLTLDGSVAYNADGIHHAKGTLSWKEALQACGDQSFSMTAKRRRDTKGEGVLSYLNLDGHGLTAGAGASTHVLVCDVEVDTLLGRVKVLNTYSAVGAGKVFVPRLARSQIEGGITMGISYTLYEDRQIDLATGHVLTHNLEDCRLAGIGDMPEMQIEFIESGFEHSQSKGIGIGEAAMVPVAASIASAVYHATGWQPTQLPIRPEHIIEGMRQQHGQEV